MRPAGLSVVLLFVGLFALPAHAQESLIDLSGRGARVSRAGASGRLVEPGPSRDETLRRFLRGQHDETTLAGLQVTREHASRGMVHLAYQQRAGNLDVYGTFVRASFTQAGDLRSVGENLVPATRAIRPSLVGPDAALRAVLARYYPEVATSPGEVSDIGNVVTFARVDPLAYQPTVKRVALPLRGAVLDAGYLVVTWDTRNVLRHTAVSGRGEIVGEQLRTYNDDYFVFPISPGVGPQTLISAPASPVASPLGWLTGSTTTGNNVDAYLDRDNNDVPDSPDGRPNGSRAGTFSFIWDPLADPTTSNNQRAAVTNLFYHANLFHDRMYAHGFTETAGNFQQSNVGRGGVEGDALLAEAQDGGGTNNANFSFATPDDGQPGKVQMYLWSASTPWRDGALDADIIYHEYGHGLTWRMVGDMSGVTGASVGEGFSDAIAAYLTGDDRIAEYSYNNPNGIRNYPYTNYPRTYGLVVGMLGPHIDGEIFAGAMWRLRELWLGQGWSHNVLLDYVVDGLNYVLPKPAFEHMRDGILASIANTGGSQAESCTVWRAFAQQGVGVGASGNELCVFGLCLFQAVESFAVPPECPSTPVNTVPLVLIQQPASGTSVTQGASVTFVGTASDTQDGDLTAALSWESSLQGAIGTGGSFSLTSLSVGTHVITARATDSGALTGSDSITLTIQPSAPPPNTAPTVTISSPTNGITVTQGTSVTFSATATDNEDGNIAANLVWTSNLQGQIGTGASFSRSDLVQGLHAVSAVVTDAGGLVGTATVGFTVAPAPPPPQVITLSVIGRKVRNKKYADLTWSGATGANVEIYRNNVKVVASTPNDGTYTDSPTGKGNSFTYRVCELGGAICSNSFTVTY
jgi:extracellular elastinolytic metalloproteinase